LKKGVKEILAAKKPIDVLINNAGMIYGATMNMLPLGKLEEVFRVNVFAQVQMMQLVSRRMIAQKSGRIINMCSALGMEIAPGSLAYGSSKAALIWITKLAAAELGEYNINVNGIAPGYIDTDMGRTNDNQREVIEKTVLKRLGTPAEVADTALFLASPESSFMTGQIISVDGGRLL
ncbi:MAG: SDR family oxidoreductase, partial [Ruminiclostridium sp.]|nr:SDR family oxidoreductase [Ruminiclostridium sp.]